MRPDRNAVEREPLAMRVEVSLYGELDASNARDFEAELSRWVEANGTRQTVINLRGLAGIDSTGLAVLLRAQQHASHAGHNLGLRRATGEVERMIALTGLDETLPFID
jgi:anti-sigma B factor antagonist